MGRILQIICGAVVAVGLLGASPPEKPADKKQAETSQPAQRAPTPAALPRDKHEEDLTRTCEKGKDDRKSDLCAQWKAADSAEVAASWTRRTGIFTAIGLVIGAVTTGAAIAAALYARAAAKHADAGTKIAKEGLDHSRAAFDADLRPWLDCEVAIISHEFGDAALVVNVELRVKNIGRRPALDVRREYVTSFIDMTNTANEKIGLFFEGETNAVETAVCILPGGTYVQKAAIPLWRQEFSAFVIGGVTSIAPVIGVMVDYTWNDRTMRGRTGKSYSLGARLAQVGPHYSIVIDPPAPVIDVSATDWDVSLAR